MSTLYSPGMSGAALRLLFLRQQRADLQHWIDNPLPSTDGRSKAARANRLTRVNLTRVDDILRGVAGTVIAGTYTDGQQ